MQDFVYKFAKKSKSKASVENELKHYQHTPIYFYVIDSDLIYFKSIAEASSRYGIVPATVHYHLRKSKDQTLQEFMSDTTSNKFLYSDDPKVQQIKQLLGL